MLSFLSFFAVAEPLDVKFQSKMSPDWLTQEPAANESLELSLMRLIFAHNSGLRPGFALVNHTKASELTRTSPNSCMASILKNPQREAEFLFSKPFSAIEGLKLYLAAESMLHQRLQTKLKQWGGKVRLRELLLTEPDFIIGLDRDRSYGSDLDLLFKENAVSRNLYFKQSGAQIAQLWPMLQQHRVSAVLEYPFMLATTDASKLEGYNVAEAESLQLAYFSCNKSETGQAIIDQLNQSIESMAGTQAYLDLHLKTVPAERQQDFLQNYNMLMLGDSD
ncbi:hypothetical protein Rhein_0395 [Rheinheimera sp. A13L]|nr:hypothetical protein Rhein_0395 [Rheinheimera sp. A13L]